MTLPKLENDKHGDTRCHVEAASHVGRAQGDLDQVFRRGLDVDAGVGQEVDLALARDHGVAAGNPVQALAHADDLQGGTNRVGKMLRDTGDERVGIAHVDHHRAEDIAIVDQSAGFQQGHAPTLAQAKQFLDVGFAMVRGSGIDDLHAFQIHTQLLRAALNLGRLPEKNGIANLFFDQHVTGAQDFLVVAFGKYNLLWIRLGLVNHGARDFVGLAQSSLKLGAIGKQIDGLLSHSAAHGGFGYGRRLPHQNARIKGLGNEIFAPELQPRHTVGAANRIRHIFFGEIGKRMRGGQLHLFVDGSGRVHREPHGR